MQQSKQEHDYLALTPLRAAPEPSEQPYTPQQVSDWRDAIILTEELVQAQLERQREEVEAELEHQLADLERQISILEHQNHEGVADFALENLRSQHANVSAALLSAQNATSLAAISAIASGMPALSAGTKDITSASFSSGQTEHGVFLAEITIEHIQHMSFEQMSSSFGVAEYAQMSFEQRAAVQEKLDQGYQKYDDFNRDMQSKIEAKAAVNGVDISEEIIRQRELERQEKAAKTRLELAEAQMLQAENQLAMGEKAGMSEEELVELRKKAAETRARYEEQRELELGAELSQRIEGKTPEEKEAIIAERIAQKEIDKQAAESRYLSTSETRTEEETLQASIDYNSLFGQQQDLMGQSTNAFALANSMEPTTSFVPNNPFAISSEEVKTAALEAIKGMDSIALAEAQPEEGESQTPYKTPESKEKNTQQPIRT